MKFWPCKMHMKCCQVECLPATLLSSNHRNLPLPPPCWSPFPMLQLCILCDFLVLFPYVSLSLTLAHSLLDPWVLLWYPRISAQDLLVSNIRGSGAPVSFQLQSFFLLCKAWRDGTFPSLLNSKHSPSSGQTNYFLLFVKTLKQYPCLVCLSKCLCAIPSLAQGAEPKVVQLTDGRQE